MLSQDFIERMKNMLGAEFSDFIESYDEPPKMSFRINTIKNTGNETNNGTYLENRTGWKLTGVDWCHTGYYCEKDVKPGSHPYHEAGVYYIQEASAMLPASLLKAEPGEKVLDLCGAPGGKSSQIACSMEGKGLLICNEIIPSRAKILSENMERMGIRNAVVINEDSGKLAGKFPEFFDRIMVDAPCSGEGMFRKNSDAIEEWSLENVQACGERQDEILENAARMLKNGGRMVYSTCTFAPYENEGTIYRFLKRHPEFELEEAEVFCDGFDRGHKEWILEEDGKISSGVCDSGETQALEEACIDNILDDFHIERCIRIWPHKIDGEGHFAAVIKKRKALIEPELESKSKKRKDKNKKILTEKELKDYRIFEKDYLKVKFEGDFVSFGDQLYLLPEGCPSLDNIKVLRPGLHLGTFMKNRFEPGHALALYLSKNQARFSIDLNVTEALNYINGQTVNGEHPKGWNLVCVDGYSLGWGKCAGDIVKNHYPKGLRKNIHLGVR